jgi:hypothetical protein
MPSQPQEPQVRPHQGRIPATLQAVFLASNRGNDVHKPPPQKVAYKVFFRSLFFTRHADSKTKRTGIFRGSKKNKQQEQKKPIAEPVAKPVAKPVACCLPSPTAMEPTAPVLSPQAYLDQALRERGYSTRRYKVLESAYYNKPTALQLASYDVNMLKMIVRDADEDAVRKVLSCGISPNACNKFGESLIHKVCRIGSHQLLRVFMECGAEIQVSDDYGRTPLHDSAWGARPAFQAFELVLQHDPRMIHMVDVRGAVPLAYVQKEHYGPWIEFLESILDIYWMPRDISKFGDEAPDALVLEKPNSRPIANPANALSAELAASVASGKMDSEDALMIKNKEGGDDSSTDTTDDESYYFDEEDDDESSVSDDDDESYNSDEEEEDEALIREMTKLSSLRSLRCA